MTHSPEQMRQKAEAMADADRHAQNSTVDGSPAREKEYSFYDQMGQQQNEFHEPAPVSKAMLKKEYTKSPGGGYVHKAKGTY